MAQLNNSRPKSLTPLRPILTTNINSPPRKYTTNPNKTILAKNRNNRGRKDEFFRNLTENAKLKSFFIDKHATELSPDELNQNKELQYSNYESRSPEYIKNDNHFHSRPYYNVPIHIRNLSGDINFPNGSSPTVKPKVPKVLKKLPNITPSSPNQRLNTTTTHNERYSTPEDFNQEREPRFFTEGCIDERSYTPISKYAAESKTSKLTDLTFYDSKAETFHLRSGSFGSKTFVRKQIAMKNVRLDLSANNKQKNFDIPTKRQTKFQIANKFNKPGPYRIKFFHEERERVAREYANFYQIGDNLKKLERTNPIPIHIREYIHKLNNLN